jgi:hypothetical protein
MNKFAMEEWESAEDFSLFKLLSQWETTFPLEKKPHVKLPEKTGTKGNYISAREKTPGIRLPQENCSL